MKGNSKPINAAKVDDIAEFKAMKSARAAVITIPDPKYSGRLWTWFGEADNAPNLWTYAIDDSPTAKKCVRKLQQFIKGKGFIENGDLVINANGMTANELLSEFARSAAYWSGAHVAIIKFNGGGDVGSVYPWQVSFTRYREHDGMYLSNTRFGTSRRTMEREIEHLPFNRFEGKEKRVDRVLRQVQDTGKQSGDLLLRFTSGEGQLKDIYPIPDAFSGLSTIIADAKLANKDLSLIRNGFSADKIITYPRKLNRADRDEAGKTEHDYYKEAVSQFTGEDGSGVMLLDGDFIDLMPDVKHIDNKAALDSTEGANIRIPKAVCRLFDVPPVLIGMDVANILGNTKALADSMKVFSLAVEEYQGLIMQTFRQLWPSFNWEIEPLNLFEYLPNEQPIQP